MIWSFFGIGHRKGAHDGTRTVIKQFLQQEQLNAHGVPLRNIADVITFLCDRLFKKPETSYIHWPP
jgi:hypothetical protein